MVDPFQAGAGTSHNMNANEVIANLANEALGGARGSYEPVHPNDHVNMAQSTNDVIPTVIARGGTLNGRAAAAAWWTGLARRWRPRPREFDGVLKSGRTHLQDAVPVRLGQEFGAYAQAVRTGSASASPAPPNSVKRLGIGGTAAGTGLNAHPAITPAMVARAVAT